MPEGSSIIFVSTTLTVSSNVTPGFLLYCSTKGAIEQMTRVLAKDLGRRNISVNCAAPGPTATKLFMEEKSPQEIEALEKMTPQGRIGTPEEVAEAIALLCVPGAKWVNGQILRINGGFA
jgi:3-oxoacyl-[acyl-carrier protein] reductase